MKTLTVLRHAKSSWDEPGLSDFDRPLNDRGRKSARRMGRELKTRQLQFDHLVASGAVRVRETLDHFGDGYGEQFDPRMDERIYMASAATLLAIIRELPEDSHAPLLVGHNPGLQRLLLELSREDDRGLRNRVRQKFPTAALAVVKLSAERWTEVEPGSGEIVELILPRELAD